MGTSVFVSRPSVIPAVCEEQYGPFEQYLRGAGTDPWRLGSGDYTLDARLRCAMELTESCKGAIILGYPQFEVSAHIARGEIIQLRTKMAIPTPWNQIEAPLAFDKGIPVLVVGASELRVVCSTTA